MPCRQPLHLAGPNAHDFHHSDSATLPKGLCGKLVSGEIAYGDLVETGLEEDNYKQELLSKADELIKKAEELKDEAENL